MAKGSALLLAWLLLAATLSSTLGLGVPVSAEDRRSLKRTKGVSLEQRRMVHSPHSRGGCGVVPPLQLLEGGEGPRRRAEDQLGTVRLKMALFVATCRGPGL